MSRAERRVVPPAPRLATAIREAAVALYYNSWRFVPANLIFGLVFLILLAAVSVSVLGWLVAVALVPVSVGLMAMASHYVRQRYVLLSDFSAGVRRRLLQNVLLGVLQLVVMVIFAADLSIGLAIGGIIGAILAVAAFYGMLAVWMLAVAAWPLLTDPERDGEPLLRKLRLAALLVLAHPLRMLALSVTLALLLAVSTLLLAALLIFSVALAWLVAAHYVLPAADRLEGRETLELED